MNRKKLGFLVAALLGCSVLLSGCSFGDFVDKLMGHTEKITASDHTESKIDPSKIKNVDNSLEAPTFIQNLGGVFHVVENEKVTMKVEAVVSDGGTVTYQWYTNGVASAGGGTPIEGATSAEYTAELKEPGSYHFFYVVATNEKGGKINMSTSEVYELDVEPRGQWAPDENGLNRYLTPDGGCLATMWVQIDGQTYRLDEYGHYKVGWNEEYGAYFYFNENGQLQRNAVTPDGYVTNKDGVQVRVATPEETASGKIAGA